MIKPDRERTSNIISGAITLAVVLALAGFFVVRAQVQTAHLRDAPHYVAYFDETAGIARGDQVRLMGRRVGRVVATTLVERDGRIQARVEIEVSRGLAREEGVPADSIIVVRPGGLVGRPSLHIRSGDSKATLDPGAAFGRSVSASDPDVLARYRRDIASFDDAVDEFNAFAGNRELWSDVRKSLAYARKYIEVEGKGLLVTFESLRAAMRDIGAQEESLGLAARRVAQAQPSVARGIADLANVMGEVSLGLAKATGMVQSVIVEIAAVSEGLGAVVKESNAPFVLGFFSWLRQFSAQWAASSERARYDPSMAGKLPPYRVWRRFFNAGTHPLAAPDRIEGEAKEKPPERYKPPPREPFSQYPYE